MNFYNDNDAGAAQWLRELMADGHLPHGSVDERPIQEITAADLAGFTACHFFGGIGGWPLALRLAGWPESRPVWTASCPCQPFSAAGKRRGQADERHLWPVLFRLVRECRPATIFGEQVASDDGYRWLARVRDDLEEAGYAVGCADLPACSAGAPHIRQRLFWVADGGRTRLERRPQQPAREERQAAQRSGRTGGGLADADGRLAGNGVLQRDGEHGQQPQDGGVGRLADSQKPRGRADAGAVRSGPAEGVREPEGQNVGRAGEPARDVGDCGSTGGLGHAEVHRTSAHEQAGQPDAERDGSNFWSDSILIPCRDGKARRIEPGIFPLAHGVPGRVGLLRGAGNAINPQTAAKFVRAFLETQAGVG